MRLHNGWRVIAFNGVLGTIGLHVPSVKKKPMAVSTNAMAVALALMADVRNRFAYLAQLPSTLSKYEQLLSDVLLACSTPIVSFSSLLQVSRRSRGCSIASAWTDFFEVCLMKTPTTYRCCNKHRASNPYKLTTPVNPNRNIGFNEFIHERETKPPSDPSIMLFDQVILSKRNRGRISIFGKSKTDFLSDVSDHLWRSASATPPKGKIPGDYRSIVTRSKHSITQVPFRTFPWLIRTSPCKA